MRYSINCNIPMAVACVNLVNPNNGCIYNKRITQEYKELQDFCKIADIYLGEGKEKIKLNESNGIFSRDTWIRINPAYMTVTNLNKLNILIFNAISNQTPVPYSWEKL